MAENKVQSVERAFDILEILAQDSGGVGLGAVAEQARLPRSTAFRLLAVLAARGYVRKTEDGARYRLGPGFIELSGAYLNGLELKTESAPWMRELAESLGTIVFLAVRQGDSMVYIDRYDRFAGMRRYAIIGQRKPLHCTALGKALLFDTGERELHTLLGGEFRQFGPNTHRSLATLSEDLESCRSRGWSFDDEEAEPGLRCVAAPVRDYRGRIVSAVSTSWSLEIRPELDPAKVAVHVRRAADGISQGLGYGRDAAEAR